MQALRTSTSLQPMISLRSINHTLARYYAENKGLHAGSDFTADRSIDARASMYREQERHVFRDEMIAVGGVLAPKVRDIFELRTTQDGITVICVPLRITDINDVMLEFLRDIGIIRCQSANDEGDRTLIIANSSLISSMEVAVMISHAVVISKDDIDVSALATEMFDLSMRLSYSIKINK